MGVLQRYFTVHELQFSSNVPVEDCGSFTSVCTYYTDNVIERSRLSIKKIKVVYLYTQTLNL